VVVNTVKHIFRVHLIFANRIKSQNEIKYPQKFSLLIKGLVNTTSRIVGKRQIKMQRNFYIAKSQN